MFEYAYSLDGDAANTVMDAALDTLVNYKNAVGTNGPTKGDLVFYAAGLLKRTTNVASPKTSGVLEGTEFTGLVAQGQPYAATNASFNTLATNTTLYPNGIGKIRRDPTVVYRVPLTAAQTATNANVGVSYGIAQSATGDQTVDLTQVTNLLVKVEGFTPDGKKVYVTILPSAFI
jgi:hypothetical protein